MQHGAPMWIRSNGSFSGEGKWRRCGVPEIKHYCEGGDPNRFGRTLEVARDQLGCDNTLPPKYLDALEEVDFAPQASIDAHMVSADKGDDDGGNHTTTALV